MKRLRRLTLGVAIALVLSGSAIAAPSEARKDKADNSYTFKYNATQGEITRAASSTTLTRGDKVNFYVYVDERPGADEGKRLLGRLVLRLTTDRARKYEGTFKYRVLTSEGTVAFKDTRERKIVLRPRKGHRSARIRFIYDLPSGDYSLLGTYAESKS